MALFQQLLTLDEILHRKLYTYYPKPSQTVPIRSGVIRQALSPLTNNILILDSQYEIFNVDVIAKMLKLDLISEEIYVADAHDCDNFAFELFVSIKKIYPNYPVGIIIGQSKNGEYHAWNCILSLGANINTINVVFVEPQTDEIFSKTIEKVDLIII